MIDWPLIIIALAIGFFVGIMVGISIAPRLPPSPAAMPKPVSGEKVVRIVSLRLRLNQDDLEQADAYRDFLNSVEKLSGCKL